MWRLVHAAAPAEALDFAREDVRAARCGELEIRARVGYLESPESFRVVELDDFYGEKTWGQ